MNTTKNTFMGIDLGGTNIGAAAVSDGVILASKKIKTQAKKGEEVVINRIEKVILEIADMLSSSPSQFKALCIGAPGAVNIQTGVVNDAPNLGWKDVPLGRVLQERLGLPVFVDNDVNVGVLGEYAHGSGQGTQHMVGVFVGTGIGGGVIINGQLHYGIRGAAGEIGHMVVVPDGRICGCGRQGCVEAYASKTGIIKILQEKIDAGQDSSIKKHLKKDQLTISSAEISKALMSEDKLVIEVLTSAQYYLGLLTANLVNLLDPDLIVYGGGLVEQLGNSFLKPIRKTARTHYLQQKDKKRIKILASTLGDDAGTIGAAVAAQRRLEK
jgi:glucokinase